MEEIFDVAIIGGGPAGLTAGIYSSRGQLRTLILNEGSVGGQMVLTNEIANYPGVPVTNGYTLSNIMKKQARDFGAVIKSNLKLVQYDLTGKIKSLVTDDGRKFSARSVIVATGGRPRSLNIPGEDQFRGKGISYCATCDGDFFEGKDIVVVGGGNSALEEAVTLTKFARKVTIVHQFDHFQAFQHAIDEAANNPKISFIMESELLEYSGGDKLEKVKIRGKKTGEVTEMLTDGVFLFIGYVPNSEPFHDILNLNERNEIIVSSDMETNIPGVFAAGDSVVKRYRQVTTAVSDGTIAALSAAEYLKNISRQEMP